MKEEQINKFIKWCKETEEFKNLPEHKKPIAIAMMIKKIMDIEIK